MNITPGGSRYFASNVGSGATRVTLTFPTPITEFGTHLIDIDSNSMTIDVAGESFLIPAGADGSVMYFGIVASSPFTQIVFDSGFPGTLDSFVSFDDMSIQVPAPATLGVAALGLLAAVRRRR